MALRLPRRSSRAGPSPRSPAAADYAGIRDDVSWVLSDRGLQASGVGTQVFLQETQASSTTKSLASLTTTYSA